MIAVKTSLAVAVPLLLLAAACSRGSSSAVVATPGAQITAENAEQVALLAIEAAFGFTPIGAVGSGLLAVAPPAAPAPLQLGNVVARRVDELLFAPAVLAGAVSQTLAGPDGGQVILTWEDRDGDQKVSTGDTFVSAFTAWRDGELELSGVLTVDGTVVAGTPPSSQYWSIAGRMTFVNLTVGTGADAVTIAGAVQFRRERKPTVESTRLEIDQGLAFGDALLQSGTALGYDEFPAEFAFSLSSRGAVQVPDLDGELRYETTQVFTGITLFGYPWAGVLEVRGAGDSLITVRMVDFTSTISIEVDADGDGEVDETLTADWTTL